jgi:hypothetical protein
MNAAFSTHSAWRAHSVSQVGGNPATRRRRTKMFAQIRSITLAATLAAMPLFTLAADAGAAAKCGARDDFVKALATKYKETRHVMAIVNSQTVMEIFTSPEGTWTVLITDTAGKACITAAGENWQQGTAIVAGLES